MVTGHPNDGWRCWLAWHNLTTYPIGCETRTTDGGGWQSTHPSDAKRERQVAGTPHTQSDARHERQVEVAGRAHTHRTRNANDRWLAHHTPNRTRDASDRWRWLAEHTPIERKTQTTDGGGWQTTHPSNARREQQVADRAHTQSDTRRERWVEVAARPHTHRTRDANDRCWRILIDRERVPPSHPAMASSPLTTTLAPACPCLASAPISLIRALVSRWSSIRFAGCQS